MDLKSIAGRALLLMFAICFPLAAILQLATWDTFSKYETFSEHFNGWFWFGVVIAIIEIIAVIWLLINKLIDKFGKR